MAIEALAAESAQAALTLDAGGRLVTANAAAISLLMLDWPGSVGRPLHQLLDYGVASDDPDGNEHDVPGWQPAHAVLASHAPRSLLLLRRPLYAAGGQLEGFVVLLRPSEQSSAKPEYRADHAGASATERLAGAIAHDFDNVLAIISGHLQMAQRQPVDAVVSDHLRQALLACAMSGRMTHRLAAYARSQALRPVPTDINALIEPLVAAFRRPLADRIDVVLDLAPNLPNLLVDVAGFEGMLLNLLLNAADATAARGRIAISTRFESGEVGEDHPVGNSASQDCVVLTVSDSGIGMPPDAAQRAFEPYFSTKGPEHGSGLGLATVAGFARQSGGTVELSTRMGAGTEVRVRLPVKTRQQASRT